MKYNNYTFLRWSVSRSSGRRAAARSRPLAGGHGVHSRPDLVRVHKGVHRENEQDAVYCTV